MEITVDISRNQLTEIVTNDAELLDTVLDSLDMHTIKDHLEMNGYQVFDEDAPLDDLLEGSDAYEVAEWAADAGGTQVLVEKVIEYACPEDILMEIPESDIVEYVEGNELIASKALSDYATAELMAELQRRLENAEGKADRMQKLGQEAALRNVQKGERICAFFHKVEAELARPTAASLDALWIEYNRELDQPTTPEENGSPASAQDATDTTNEEV
jgi:hypothetical protein